MKTLKQANGQKGHLTITDPNYRRKKKRLDQYTDAEVDIYPITVIPLFILYK